MTSAATRLAVIALALVTVLLAGGTIETLAYAQRTKAKPVAKAAQSAVEPAVKLRYYGGPKSPMYP